MLTEAGFKQNLNSARISYREQKKVRIVARGDDFTVLGANKYLDWRRRVVQQRMEVKFKGSLEG